MSVVQKSKEQLYQEKNVNKVEDQINKLVESIMGRKKNYSTSKLRENFKSSRVGPKNCYKSDDIFA